MLDIIDYAQTNFDINISTKQLYAFETYENELIEWNNRFNLTAINDREMIRIKHFLDSITCITLMRNSIMERVIDVGTGAGFPGLPIKIICPSIKLTLVESVGKKADFCSHIVNLLSLKGVRVINQRAEDIGKCTEFREKYDWAIARAVAILPVLTEYLLPFVKIGGNMLAMKGLNAAIEYLGENYANCRRLLFPKSPMKDISSLWKNLLLHPLNIQEGPAYLRKIHCKQLVSASFNYYLQLIHDISDNNFPRFQNTSINTRPPRVDIIGYAINISVDKIIR
jgi:16S rRNA (guanine527-N7)-methyltransferase